MTFFSQDPKPVECSLCQRKFKNIPALNGHMRLHGGYFKKVHAISLFIENCLFLNYTLYF